MLNLCFSYWHIWCLICCLFACLFCFVLLSCLWCLICIRLDVDVLIFLVWFVLFAYGCLIVLTEFIKYDLLFQGCQRENSRASFSVHFWSSVRLHCFPFTQRCSLIGAVSTEIQRTASFHAIPFLNPSSYSGFFTFPCIYCFPRYPQSFGQFLLESWHRDNVEFPRQSLRQSWEEFSFIHL